MIISRPILFSGSSTSPSLHHAPHTALIIEITPTSTVPLHHATHQSAAVPTASYHPHPYAQRRRYCDATRAPSCGIPPDCAALGHLPSSSSHAAIVKCVASRCCRRDATMPIRPMRCSSPIPQCRVLLAAWKCSRRGHDRNEERGWKRSTEAMMVTKSGSESEA
jgi:hypothetical protein